MRKAGEVPVPGYVLLKKIGEGSFGEVWRASAPGGCAAALKFVQLSDRFGRKELDALSFVKQLRHPNLMPVTAFWLRAADGTVLSGNAPSDDKAELQNTITWDGESPSEFPEPPAELVVAMGLADTSLFERLLECRRQGLAGIPRAELLPVMEDAARAIDFLNSPTHCFAGSEPMAVQHCDIKPHNILVVGGGAQVCDFGLARLIGRGCEDVMRSTVGTVAYMAPECLVGTTSSATDQYSLAVSYAHLVSGKLPYEVGDLNGIRAAIEKGELAFSLLSANELVVLQRATARCPDDRFPTARAFIAALRESQTLANVLTSSSAVGQPRASFDFDRLNTRVALLALAILIGVTLQKQGVLTKIYSMVSGTESHRPSGTSKPLAVEASKPLEIEVRKPVQPNAPQSLAVLGDIDLSSNSSLAEIESVDLSIAKVAAFASRTNRGIILRAKHDGTPDAPKVTFSIPIGDTCPSVVRVFGEACYYQPGRVSGYISLTFRYQFADGTSAEQSLTFDGYIPRHKDGCYEAAIKPYSGVVFASLDVEITGDLPPADIASWNASEVSLHRITLLKAVAVQSSVPVIETWASKGLSSEPVRSRSSVQITSAERATLMANYLAKERKR